MIMKTFTLSTVLTLTSAILFAQTAERRLDITIQTLLKDEQMKHAIMSLYVVETKTNRLVYKYKR